MDDTKHNQLNYTGTGRYSTSAQIFEFLRDSRHLALKISAFPYVEYVERHTCCPFSISCVRFAWTASINWLLTSLSLCLSFLLATHESALLCYNALPASLNCLLNLSLSFLLPSSSLFYLPIFQYFSFHYETSRSKKKLLEQSSTQTYVRDDQIYPLS
jgi:hypothetical protein